jgi:hypothetical protein
MELVTAIERTMNAGTGVGIEQNLAQGAVCGQLDALRVGLSAVLNEVFTRKHATNEVSDQPLGEDRTKSSNPTSQNYGRKSGAAWIPTLEVVGKGRIVGNVLDGGEDWPDGYWLPN